RGQAGDAVAAGAAEDRAGAEEADRGDDRLNQADRIHAQQLFRVLSAEVGRDQVAQADQQRRGAGHQHVRAEARGAVLEFALEADHPAQQHGVGGRGQHGELRAPVVRGETGDPFVHGANPVWAPISAASVPQPATRRTRAKLRLPTASMPSKPGSNTRCGSSTTAPSTRTARSRSLRLASELLGVSPAAVSSAAIFRPSAGTTTSCSGTWATSPCPRT